MTPEKNDTQDYYFWLGADGEAVEVDEAGFSAAVEQHRQDREDFLNVR